MHMISKNTKLKNVIVNILIRITLWLKFVIVNTIKLPNDIST